MAPRGLDAHAKKAAARKHKSKLDGNISVTAGNRRWPHFVVRTAVHMRLSSCVVRLFYLKVIPWIRHSKYLVFPCAKQRGRSA